MQIRTWFGIFTIENNTIVDAEIFPKDLAAITERLLHEQLLLRGNVSGEDLCDLAVRYGFAGSKNEYNSMLHELNIMLATQQVARTLTPDRKIIAAVEALDDINETSNILSERLSEWYILNYQNTNLKGKELALKILKDEEQQNPDLEIMQSFSSTLIGTYAARERIEEYLKENMALAAPNLTGIAGHILGARLLSMAGSLEKLAFMPSSTIQVMGASNALFKHLKGKAPSPKHGVIFRHPFVNTAPLRQRGKIARIIASKISLAAKIDLYSGELREDIADEMKKKVEAVRKRTSKKKKRRNAGY